MIGTATGYGLEGRCSIPSGRKILFSIEHSLVPEPTQPPTQWALWALSLGIKRSGREADHSPPSSAVFKNGGTIRPLLHTSSWRGA
jgi:hypothetical protein